MKELEVVREWGLKDSPVRLRLVSVVGVGRWIERKNSTGDWVRDDPSGPGYTFVLAEFARLAAELEQEKTAAKKLYVGLGRQVEKLCAELEQAHKDLGVALRELEVSEMAKREDEAVITERDQLQAIVDEGDGALAKLRKRVLELEGQLVEKVVGLDAEIEADIAAARREGYEKGQEEMRERAAEQAGYPYDDEIRALPLRPEAP